MKIIAFDPGKTTGWSMHTLYKDELTGGLVIDGGQLEPEHHYDLYTMLYRENPDVIVYEQFTYQIRKAKDGGHERVGVDLSAKEYIGILKLWEQLHKTHNKCKIVSQTPSQAKGFFTDEKLKTMGLYAVSEPHRNDATRHLLYFITMNLKRRDYLHFFKPNK